MTKYIQNEQGLLHCEDGPAVVWADGSKEWWLNGKPHREGGHAIEHKNGDKEWYKHGQLHRIDGPAIEYADGTKEWFISGEEVTEEEFTEASYLMNVLKRTN